MATEAAPGPEAGPAADGPEAGTTGRPPVIGALAGSAEALDKGAARGSTRGGTDADVDTPVAGAPLMRSC
jgi:hypothetical protein